MGLEPTSSWTTTRGYHQLSYGHREPRRIPVRAGVAELVDAPALGAGGPGRGGSSPLARMLAARWRSRRLPTKVRGRHPGLGHAVPSHEDSGLRTRRKSRTPRNRGSRSRRRPRVRPCAAATCRRACASRDSARAKRPAAMVMRQIGREALVEEALRDHLNGWYSRAVAVAGIDPVSRPDDRLVGRAGRGRAVHLHR